MAIQQAASPPLPCVLIVDDDPQGLRLLHSILEDMAELVFARSGEEALTQVALRNPDLILLDAQMPGLGGYATCAHLKRHPETADIPVVFVTAHTDTDSETHALELGADDFIHKPINPPVVRARVRTQLALKQKADALRRLTNIDPLTGIANRRAFDEALNLEWRRSMRTREPLSLLLLDVDCFKQYNDAYGHPAGDNCLRQVAAVLGNNARRAGDRVARYGGEEFAIILPHTDASDAWAFAVRVCADVRTLGIVHEASLVQPYVTVSVGVGCVFDPCAGQDRARGQCLSCSLASDCIAAADSLLSLADQALYHAKQNGRNQVACLRGIPERARFEHTGGDTTGPEPGGRR